MNPCSNSTSPYIYGFYEVEDDPNCPPTLYNHIPESQNNSPQEANQTSLDTPMWSTEEHEFLFEPLKELPTQEVSSPMQEDSAIERSHPYFAQSLLRNLKTIAKECSVDPQDTQQFPLFISMATDQAMREIFSSEDYNTIFELNHLIDQLISTCRDINTQLNLNIDVNTLRCIILDAQITACNCNLPMTELVITLQKLILEAPKFRAFEQKLINTGLFKNVETSDLYREYSSHLFSIFSFQPS